MNRQNATSLIKREVRAINATFRQHGVKAGIERKNVLVSPYSHVEYGVSIAPGQAIAAIEKRIPEITNAVARLRKAQTPIMFSWNPLSISVPFPDRIVMPWDAGQVARLHAGQMLLGKSFDRHGAHLETTTFDESPHILVAGTTGAGKSVLLQSMIASLCANTSPDDLRLVLVDLKNEDLTPFAGWPHVTLFARTLAEAESAIMRVQAEKDARIMDPSRKPYRLVLVIDELAQLAEQKHVVTALGDVASIGRSKLINLIVATQHPTEKGGMG
ncbi:MAG: AAA family ATPase, partial [Caldilineaceae bacterium]|nr:AAA family ATPase [Caldilineaceae bacterium]